MNAPQRIEQLARRMSSGQDCTAWARTPPARGAAGSAWERMIVELAEAGDPRFVKVLAEHVQSGVIRSERAAAALQGAA